MLWLNVDSSLRNLEQFHKTALETVHAELSVIEAYILWALYEKDGQRASELASAVGRAATSFTPILDKLQLKKLIERQPHPIDRRCYRDFPDA